MLLRSLALALAIVGCGAPKEKSDEDLAAEKLTAERDAARQAGTYPDDVLEPDTPVSPDQLGKVKLTFWGKSIWLDDQLYELSCNQFFFDFSLTRDSDGCLPTTVATDLVFPDDDSPTYSAWTIKSPTGGIDIAAKQFVDEDKLTIAKDGESIKYGCYFFDGDAWTTYGGQAYKTSHVFVTKRDMTRTAEAAAKPFADDEVLVVGATDEDFCKARFDN